jgi:hypothetical protein
MPKASLGRNLARIDWIKRRWLLLYIYFWSIGLNLNFNKQGTLSTYKGILSWILVKQQVCETLLTSRVKSSVLKWMTFHISVAFHYSFSNTTSVTEACVPCREGKKNGARLLLCFSFNENFSCQLHSAVSR